MPSSDWKVQLVDADGDPDYSVSVVGDQVVDLTGAATGDLLAVQPDGLVAPQTRYGAPAAGQSHLTAVRRVGVLDHAGPPVTADGTFAVGDCVFDPNGQDWLCTTAGTPGTWVAVGSGRVLGSARSTSNFTMTTAATVEDVPTMAATFTFDGRPVIIRTTPVYTAQDQVAVKGITLTIVRASDNAIQATGIRLSTASATESQSQLVETGPFTAWPSDAAALVVGTQYTVKLRLLAGASSKATVFGATQPYSLYVVTG